MISPLSPNGARATRTAGTLIDQTVDRVGFLLKSPMPPPATRAIVLACILTLLFFAIDLRVPGEINVAFLYGLSIGACAWSQSRRFLWALTGVCVILTGVGQALGPPPITGNAVLGLLWINRALVAAGLVALAGFVHQWIQRSERLAATQAHLRELNDSLEALVTERTSALMESNDRLHKLRIELAHVSRVTEMGHMAAGLAHEVNQPLTAATNYLQAGQRLLRNREISADRTAGIIESALAQVVRAADIVRRLREFVRKGEGEGRPENLRTVVEEAAALALIGARERGIRVRLGAAMPELPAVRIDKVQIQQVVVNLMRNAIEAMADSARRELTVAIAADADGMVAVRIVDTGPGIAPEIADRLFQPFVTTKPQGMGVGLWICRAIVEGHGGKLWVEANPEGGTMFSFTVPRAD